MSKILRFSHPKLFSGTFTGKYDDFKRDIVRNAGHVDLRQIMPTLMEIKLIETPHRVMLTQLAIDTAKSLFPVIEITGIQFDVAIEENISHGSISENGTPDEPEELPETPNPTNQETELFQKAAKQKILNGFSQGAAVSMNTIHHMVNELDTIHPQLKAKYDFLMKANEVAYLITPEPIMADMACMANENGDIGGTNKVEFRNGVPYIVAKAVNFVTMVHEIIKGVYTYLALNGYESEDEYYEVCRYTESIASEIEDIGSGKMILNLLRNYLLDNFDKYYVHDCFFEMYIVAIAKLPADEAIALMKSLVDGVPNRAKFETLARNCFYDLKEFDKQQINL